MKKLPVGWPHKCELSFTYAALCSKKWGIFLGLLLLQALFVLCASGQTLPPYSTSFESVSGYTFGNLASQDGWQVPGGSALITDDTAFAGTFSIGLQAGGSNANITHSFAAMAGSVATWIDFQARPTVAWAFGNSTTITAEGSGIGLVRLDAAGHIVVFDGDGNGGGRWVVTGRSVALNGSGRALNWVRVTIRQDYAAKKWDLYIDGQLALPGLGLRDNTKTFLSQFSLVSANLATAYLDSFYVGPTCPLFTDADDDGMDDAWEAASGLNPALNDRESDLDGDGITNIEEYALGTNPGNTSTQGDGISDGWKVSHGLSPLGAIASADPGNVGRTVLQSYQQNLSPWPTPAVADGLQFWLRADAGISKDASGNITSWQDISGRSLIFTQADSARLPQWLASAVYGQPAVQFNGSSFLRTPAPVDEQLGSSDVTIIAVAVPGSTQPAYSSLVDLSSDTSQGFVVGQVGNNTNQFQLWFMDAAQSGWYSSPAAATTAGQVQIVSLIKNGASASSYLNGVSQGTSNVPVAMLNPIAALAVGNRASGYYGYNGQIAEVLVYNRALTNTERSQIEHSLKTKYVNPDADGNGLPDAWELQYVGGAGNDSSADPGGVGRTLLQSYQQGLSPWPAPTVAAGLRSWYVAGLGLSKDAFNKISLWTDISGNGGHVRQTTDTLRQPAWVASAMNGQPAVQFDGSTFLKTSEAIDELAGSTDVTVITVAVPAATQPAYSSLVDLSSDTSQGFVVGQVANNTNQFQLWFMDAARSGWYSGPAAGTSAGQVQVISVVKNGPTASSYLNGTSQGSGTVPQAMLTPTAALAVGNRASGNYGYNGQIAEVLVYNRALSDSERSQIEAALQTKYISTDADANGLPDVWEKQYFGHAGNDPASDPGSTGRTLLQSYQQSVSPWPAASVVSGLRGWYRADLGVTKDASNIVSGWVDLSGNGGHVAQSGALQPTWVASAMFNHPAVQFDGTTFLRTTAPVDALVGSSDMTVIAVASAAPIQHAYSSLVDLSSDTARGFVLGQLGGNTNQYQLWFMDAAQSGWYAGPAATATAGQVAVISTVKQGATAKNYLNGTSQGSATVPSALLTPTAVLALGNRASGNYGYTGQISEVLIYNRALSDSERSQIETSLQAKYINPDLDGDGLPDAWEQQYLDALTYGANDDPGGVSRTLLQSYQQGLSPWPAPTLAAGLRAWYRADLGVTKDANNKLSGWTDLSGQSSHLGQTTDPARQPLLVATAISGKPAVQFDGSTFLKTSAAVDELAGSTDVTVITVAVPAATQPAYASLVDLSSDTARGFVVGQVGNNTNQFQLWFMDAAQSGWYSSPAAVTTTAQVQVISVVKNGTTAAAYLNGTSQGTGTVPQAMLAPVAVLAVGNRASGNYGYNGQIAEVLVYNRALSDAERTSIESALQAKYIFTDADGNGLADAWELMHFGHLGVDPNADPDGDGLTNLQESQQGSDPTDFFNGTLPILTILSGNNQTGAAGQFNSQSFIVSVKNAAGTAPLMNAPVAFIVQSGGGRLALTGSGSPSLSTSLTRTTDATGTAQVFYQQPASANASSVILVKAGQSEVTFTTTTGPSGDSDNNGLPDAWELQYFGRTGIDPNADANNNGISNLQEYLNGTNPTSGPPPSAPGGLTSEASTSNNIVLRWTAAQPADGRNIARYDVFINGVKVGSTVTTELSVPFDFSGKMLRFFSVRAIDDQGNISALSNEHLIAASQADVELQTKLTWVDHDKQGVPDYLNQGHYFKTSKYSERYYWDIYYTNHDGEPLYDQLVASLRYDVNIVASFDLMNGRWDYSVTGAFESFNMPDWPTNANWIVGSDNYGSPVALINPQSVTYGSYFNKPLLSRPYYDEQVSSMTHYQRGDDLTHVEGNYVVVNKAVFDLSDEDTNEDVINRNDTAYNENMSSLLNADWNTEMDVFNSYSYTYDTGGADRSLATLGYFYQNSIWQTNPEYESIRSLSKAGGYYRFASKTGGMLHVRWLEVFDNYYDPPVVLTDREQTVLGGPDGAQTAAFTVNHPTSDGEIDVCVVPTGLNLLTPSMTPIPGAPRLFQPNAVFTGETVMLNLAGNSVLTDAVALGLEYIVPSTLKLDISGDIGSLQIVAIDTAIVASSGLDAAVAQGQVITSGTDIRPFLISQTTKWDFVAIATGVPGKATLTFHINNYYYSHDLAQEIMVYPKADLAVDANRDGTITLDGSDTTAANLPYRFWLNDDVDRGHTVDGTDYEQDDISPTEAAANNWVEDWKSNTVPFRRDLEDFARIVVSTSGLSDAFRNGDLYMGLKWTDTVGTPSIKLYKQYDATGGTSYLTDDYQASVQLAENAILNQRYPSDDVASPSAHTVVTPGDVFVLPQALWFGLSGDTLKRSLLFEGCTAGTGQLKLVILKRENGSYTEIGDGPGVWLDLKNIKDMYEHWTVGQGSVPYGGGAPGALSQASSFTYTAQSPEESKYILFVHGWNMEKWEKERFAETAYKRLYWQGYKGRFGLFSWPTTNGFDESSVIADSNNYDRGEFSAWRSASLLKQKLVQLNSQYPNQVHLLAHSMGNVVAGEALRLAGQEGLGVIVRTYVASQAALPVHCYNGSLPDSLDFDLSAIPVGGVVRVLDGGWPQTANAYKSWLAANSAAVAKRVNFYNVNDWALWHDKWGLNQWFKPDHPDFRPNPPDPQRTYRYLDNINQPPTQDGFGWLRPGGQVDPSDRPDLNNRWVAVLRLGNATDVKDRYEIMAMASEARSNALGATSSDEGLGNRLLLASVWPSDPSPSNDNRPYARHKWHSAQFRSTNMLQKGYWQALLDDRGFNIVIQP